METFWFIAFSFISYIRTASTKSCVSVRINYTSTRLWCSLPFITCIIYTRTTTTRTTTIKFIIFFRRTCTITKTRTGRTGTSRGSILFISRVSRVFIFLCLISTNICYNTITNSTYICWTIIFYFYFIFLPPIIIWYSRI